jgi:transaldolase
MAYFPASGISVGGKNLEDNGVVSGIDLVEQCVKIVGLYRFESEVLAAPLSNPRQVREPALVGAHIATLPFPVIRDMLRHHKTFEGMELFTKDIVAEYAELR